MESNLLRKIVHVDMDAFFAAIEQRDCPELRGMPIAVGGSGGRGVVMTASYEARKYGVRSAMPAVIAKRKCPELIFVDSHFDKYREASRIIRQVFHSYTDLVEPLSLDEAYLDVTENKMHEPYASVVARDIRRLIYDKTGLTASAGVSYNKFLAKIASDMNKPNGQTVIRPEQAQEFLDKLPIEKFHGVGKVTAEKMHNLDIENGLNLKSMELEALVSKFGKVGKHFYNVVRGVDNREVNPNCIRKSVSVENTFSQNKNSTIELSEELESVVERLMPRLEKVGRFGFTLTLKLKTSNFEILNRSVTDSMPFIKKEAISERSHELLGKVDMGSKSFRLIGLKVSNFRDSLSDENIGQQEFDFLETVHKT